MNICNIIWDYIWGCYKIFFFILQKIVHASLFNAFLYIKKLKCKMKRYIYIYIYRELYELINEKKILTITKNKNEKIECVNKWNIYLVAFSKFIY